MSKLVVLFPFWIKKHLLKLLWYICVYQLFSVFTFMNLLYANKSNRYSTYILHVLWFISRGVPAVVEDEYVGLWQTFVHFVEEVFFLHDRKVNKREVKQQSDLRLLLAPLTFYFNHRFHMLTSSNNAGLILLKEECKCTFPLNAAARLRSSVFLWLNRSSSLTFHKSLSR